MNDLFKHISHYCAVNSDSYGFFDTIKNSLRFFSERLL